MCSVLFDGLGPGVHKFAGNQACLEKTCLEEACANGQVQLHSKHKSRCGGFYFVCDHGKHRNAKQYKFVCICLLGGEKEVTPKIVPFSKKKPHYRVSLHKQSRNPLCIYIYIYI